MKGCNLPSKLQVAETHFLLGKLYVLQSDCYPHSKVPEVDNFALQMLPGSLLPSF